MDLFLMEKQTRLKKTGRVVSAVNLCAYIALPVVFTVYFSIKNRPSIILSQKNDEFSGMWDLTTCANNIPFFLAQLILAKKALNTALLW